MPCIRPAAIPLRGGSAAARSRRRSSSRHCRSWSPRSPRRRCIHRSRSAPPANGAEDPCRNIRSSAGVAVPWSSRDVWTRRTIANQTRDANGESPSISAMPVSFPRCAIAHRGCANRTRVDPSSAISFVQVGNSRLGWRRPGIHTPDGGYGFRVRSFHSRPGMTITNAACAGDGRMRPAARHASR